MGDAVAVGDVAPGLLAGPEALGGGDARAFWHAASAAASSTTANVDFFMLTGATGSGAV